MDWLCCFVKDKGCTGIIDFVVFSMRAARMEHIDKPSVCMCVVFLFQAQSILSKQLNPRVFCNINTIFQFLAERYFKYMYEFFFSLHCCTV